jgi:hypothetical protein
VYSFWNEDLDGKIGIIIQNKVDYCDHPFYELFGDLDLDEIEETCYEIKIDNFIYLFTDYELVDEFEKYMLNEANSIESEIVKKYMIMTDEPYDPLAHELEMQYKQQLLDAAKGLMDDEEEEDYYLAETKVPYLKVSRKVCDSDLET